jgi:hypothetical protein
MMAASFANLGQLSWEYILIPVIGLTSACLAVAVSRLLSGKRSPMAAPPAPQPAKLESDPFISGGAAEKRVAFRRQGNPVEVTVATDNDEKTELTRGWVVDRSSGGLCLSLFQELEVGTVVNVRPRRADPVPPWVRVEVRKCRHLPDGWEVGCQFVRTPPWSVLLLFG